MYFGKPISEWIVEHRGDTITLGEIADACEKSRRISEELMKETLEKGFEAAYSLSAYAYFAEAAEKSSRPLDLALNILGERYGYPDNPPEEDEKGTE